MKFIIDGRTILSRTPEGLLRHILSHLHGHCVSRDTVRARFTGRFTSLSALVDGLDNGGLQRAGSPPITCSDICGIERGSTRKWIWMPCGLSLCLGREVCNEQPPGRGSRLFKDAT